jgi:hypothetical protein
VAGAEASVATPAAAVGSLADALEPVPAELTTGAAVASGELADGAASVAAPAAAVGSVADVLEPAPVELATGAAVASGELVAGAPASVALPATAVASGVLVAVAVVASAVLVTVAVASLVAGAAVASVTVDVPAGVVLDVGNPLPSLTSILQFKGARLYTPPFTAVGFVNSAIRPICLRRIP